MRGLSEIETIGIVGAGTMGSGIAQVAATSGFEVVMRDVEPELVDRGFDTIEDSLDRLVARDSLDEQAAEAARDRITGTTDLEALAQADYVVEAVVEDLGVKREVFAALDDHVDAEVCLATNTSTLSITSIASATDRER
ncbi:MAG: 3-hydroxyacyl-CoA dehydrogenase family protein, partial [Halobacteriales archaeon]